MLALCLVITYKLCLRFAKCDLVRVLLPLAGDVIVRSLTDKAKTQTHQPGKSGLLGHTSAISPRAENRLLSTLPLQEYERLSPYLQFVTFPLGKVLYESGVRLQYVYFPTTSIVS